MSINSEALGRMDFSDVADGNLPPVHPGEILREDFLRPLGLTQYRLAKDIGVSPRRISEILAGKRAVTADTGLRLSQYFGLNDGFWIGLQTDHDLACVFHAKVDTDSTPRWTVIPRQAGHLFQGKLDT